MVFEEVIVGNSPELMNDTKTQTEKKKKATTVIPKQDKRKSRVKHIIVKS